MLKFAALIFVASYAMGATCESLNSLSIPHTTIVAESVAAGAFAPPAARGRKRQRKGRRRRMDAFGNLPAFCRVQVTSKPSADSDIKIEYWLPVAGWNGNFEANGNGGWTGSITPNTLATGMERGYAAAMTDTGHEGGSASFAVGHPEKVIDFGYRSVHEMATTGQSADQGILRARREAFLLERLLGGRAARADGSAAVSRRFRRRCGRLAGPQLDRPVDTSRVDRAGHA